jgi:hypothetical protein
MAAFTITTLQPGTWGWIINATSADISGCEELKAAVVGSQIVIDHLTVNNGGGAQSITIGEGENAGAVKTALIGPIAMAASASIQWDFPSGIVLTVSESLTADSSSNTAVTVFAYGRIK